MFFRQPADPHRMDAAGIESAARVALEQSAANVRAFAIQNGFTVDEEREAQRMAREKIERWQAFQLSELKRGRP